MYSGFSRIFSVFLCLFSSPLLSTSVHKHFAVVVDIGSTGTRSHIFEFEFDRHGCQGGGAAHLSLPEKSSKIRPGFSTFIDMRQRENSITKNEAISEYLDLIKKEVDEMVPEKYRSHTPVWLLGTAGMRHFDAEELLEILTVMRSVVVNQWTGYKTHDDWVNVLDGERGPGQDRITSVIGDLKQDA